ncbi:MAG: hypothetical protein R3E09_00775 [Novosphingobium sp.]
MTEKTHESDCQHDAQESLIRLLLLDVMIAQERFEKNKTQSCMRDIVRTVFAAIEGMSWIYREHIVSAAKEVGEITLAEEMALSEVAYQVTDQGMINEQARYLPIPAAIRLTTRIAKKIAPNLDVSFGTSGWDHFRQASGVRNRITHPKTRTDLLLTSEDVSLCVSALHWLLEVAEQAMTATNLAFAAHTAEMREIFERLEKGDPETWAMYRAILAAGDE